jgi:uncharacterized coiled-coil protein SlyX
MPIEMINESGWIPVFAAGKHTFGMRKGDKVVPATKDIDTAFIDGLITASAGSNAPAVFGHPKEAAPRYGTVSELKREGKVLYAKFKDVVASFADAVNKKLYPDRSIAFDWNTKKLLHVGFLGAVPPAVEGLPEAVFMDAGTDEICLAEFSAYEEQTIGRIFQRLRDWMISKFDLDTADSIMNQYEIDTLKQSADAPKAEASFADTKPGEGTITVPASQKPEEVVVPTPEERIAELSAVVAQKDTEIAQLETENAALNQKITDGEETAKRAECAQFCDKLVAEGKMLPKDKKRAAELLFASSKQGVAEFSKAEGDGTEEKSSFEELKALFAAYPRVTPVVGEVATQETSKADSTDPQAIATAAGIYVASQAKEGVTVSFTQAVAHVMEGK